MTEPADEPALTPPAPVRRRGRAAVLLALGLAVIVVGIAGWLFWAPSLMPVLPWRAPANADAEAVLAARLARLEAAQSAQTQAITAAGAADKTALGQFDQRLHALEARPPPAAPDLSGVQQQIAALTARLDAVDKAVHAQPAGDPTDAALALIALQIGEAVRLARPFAAEYQSFVALAHDRPELAAAAAPLAEPAKTGLASRTVLARELHALAGRIAIAAPPPAADDWGDLILSRLRSLVTIRRIDGIGQSPAEAALGAAEKAMAAGDLAGAVAALQPLAGPQADAARPWLQMAAARLQVEDALQSLTTLLAARLGKAAAAASPG